MSRDYKIIDADAHVLEPPDLWQKYLDPQYRDQAPVVFEDTDGKDRFRIDGKVIGGPRGIGMAGAVGARQGEVPMTLRYIEGKRGGFEAKARIADMDSEAIDAAFLYPTLGLYSGVIADGKFAALVCRAYNRWVADHCSDYPDRLFPVAMLPMQDIDQAITELKFAREQLGMRGVFIRPNRYNGRKLDDPVYDRFWAVAQDLDVSIGVHEGAGGMPSVAEDRYDTWAERHITGHTMEMMLACLALVWGGVCERFPGLRFAFLECGDGWVAPWLDRMDRHFEHAGLNAISKECSLTTLPSVLFRRNCWISFEPVEGCLGPLATYIGPQNIIWGTDYPHSDGFFPGGPRMIREKLPDAEVCGMVLGGGARRFYKI